LEADEILLIYDYSSFTSNLTGIRRFTEALGDYFIDFHITVLDPHHGPTQISLGQLLLDYNAEANLYPEFDASEVLEVEEVVLRHSCGMLGVPGNISSCTLLHGIHLSTLVQAIRKNKVVGDDAIAAIKKLTFDDVIEAIADLGDVAREKMEEWSWNLDDEERIDERYDYKKRPINRMENIIFTGFLIDFPPLNLFGIINPFHRPDDVSYLDSRRKAIRSICTFQNQLASFPSYISEIGEKVSGFYQYWMYKRLGFSTGGGSCDVSGDFYPPIASLGLEYRTWYMRYGDWMMIRLPESYPEDVIEDIVPDVGVEFHMRLNPVISYLIKMRVLEDRTEFCWHRVKDLLGYFGDDFSWIKPASSVVRKIVVTRRLPHWFDSYFHSLGT
jgi:hypothetical protein